MKKMIFLMLTLLIWGAASMNAQVNIGSEDGPKDGAILDLSRSGKKLGLILPNVRLENVSTWQLDAGTGADAAGTVVFNTNADLKDALGTNTLGQGIFVWNGNGWQAAKGGTGEVLAKDFTLTSGGSPVTSGSTVSLWTGGTQSFAVEASSFVPTSAEVAKGVKWVISPASFAAIQAGSTNTACVVEGLTEGTATLTVTSLDNNVTKTVTIDVQPVSLQSFALSGAPLNLTTNGAAGTVTANTFIGTDGKTFPGSVTVNWAVTNGTENPSGVVKTGTTYTVTPGSSAATWTVTPSAGGFTADPFTVTITAWTGSTVSSAAKDYNISPNTNNSAGTDGSMAKGWGSAANDAGSGNYWTSYPATGATPSSGGTNLMVSNKVYSNANEVSSPNASANKQNAAQSLSALSDGITWAAAVKKCVDLTEGGFDDWYLPNSMELQVLYDNAYLGYSAIGSRTSVNYWSSTEASATYAWTRSFGSSSTDTGYSVKTYASNTNATWVARCVRRTN